MLKSTGNLLKATGLVCLFMVCTVVVKAQSGNKVAAWSTSKDVQKVANKSLFNDENLKKSHIQVVSVGTPSVAVSKGIYKTNKKAKANVVSKGIPSAVVSKSVALIGKN